MLDVPSYYPRGTTRLRGISTSRPRRRRDPPPRSIPAGAPEGGKLASRAGRRTSPSLRPTPPRPCGRWPRRPRASRNSPGPARPRRRACGTCADARTATTGRVARRIREDEVAATPRLRRGYSVKSSPRPRRGYSATTSRAAAPTWKFGRGRRRRRQGRGDESVRRSGRRVAATPRARRVDRPRPPRGVGRRRNLARKPVWADSCGVGRRAPPSFQRREPGRGGFGSAAAQRREVLPGRRRGRIVPHRLQELEQRAVEVAALRERRAEVAARLPERRVRVERAAVPAFLSYAEEADGRRGRG